MKIGEIVDWVLLKCWSHLTPKNPSGSVFWGPLGPWYVPLQTSLLLGLMVLPVFCQNHNRDPRRLESDTLRLRPPGGGPVMAIAPLVVLMLSSGTSCCFFRLPRWHAVLLPLSSGLQQEVVTGMLPGNRWPRRPALPEGVNTHGRAVGSAAGSGIVASFWRGLTVETI